MQSTRVHDSFSVKKGICYSAKAQLNYLHSLASALSRRQFCCNILDWTCFVMKCWGRTTSDLWYGVNLSTKLFLPKPGWIFNTFFKVHCHLGLDQVFTLKIQISFPNSRDVSIRYRSSLLSSYGAALFAVWELLQGLSRQTAAWKWAACCRHRLESVGRVLSS